MVAIFALVVFTFLLIITIGVFSVSSSLKALLALAMEREDRERADRIRGQQ